LICLMNFTYRSLRKLINHALQRHNTKNSKQIFPEKELRGLSPNLHIHHIHYIFPRSVCLFFCRKICGTIAHRHMNVEIGTEAAQFPEKEYINGIFLAVHSKLTCDLLHS
jgi:hypothetical protein